MASIETPYFQSKWLKIVRLKIIRNFIGFAVLSFIWQPNNLEVQNRVYIRLYYSALAMKIIFVFQQQPQRRYIYNFHHFIQAYLW